MCFTSITIADFFVCYLVSVLSHLVTNAGATEEKNNRKKFVQYTRKVQVAMNHFKLIFLTFSLLVTLANGFPQSLSEVAVAVKQTDLNYALSDVSFFYCCKIPRVQTKELLKALFSNQLQAPDLIPFDNPNHIDNVREEGEGYGSSILSVYDRLHQKTSNVFQVRDFCVSQYKVRLF